MLVVHLLLRLSVLALRLPILAWRTVGALLMRWGRAVVVVAGRILLRGTTLVVWSGVVVDRGRLLWVLGRCTLVLRKSVSNWLSSK